MRIKDNSDAIIILSFLFSLVAVLFKACTHRAISITPKPNPKSFHTTAHNLQPKFISPF